MLVNDGGVAPHEYLYSGRAHLALSLGILSPVPFVHAATRTAGAVAHRPCRHRSGRCRRARRPVAPGRRIIVDDPLVARELGIGRPDLPRDHDDGGLVDLNSPPAESIAGVCGLDAVMTERIVRARAAAEGSPTRAQRSTPAF